MNDSPTPNEHDDEQDPRDDLRDMLRDLFENSEGFDPSALAGVGGLPTDPAVVQALIGQLQNALFAPSQDIDWHSATEYAKHVAGHGHREVSLEEEDRYAHTFRLAELWLSEATDLGSLAQPPRTMTRREWIGESMGVWSQLAEPVALSIASSLSDALEAQIPPEMQHIAGQSTALLRNVGGAMFAMQLGQVVGQLSGEVVGGGDIGLPVLETQRASLIPQNVDAFGEGLDIPANEVELYLAVRELAYARLFEHAKWLPLHIMSQVVEFSKGISIDEEAINELAARIDPSKPDEIRIAFESGSFIPPRTEQQETTLARIETMLALVEGWVDSVTFRAVERLPRREALAEMMRRRRATGGPAEHAMASLVGLELRPRRLREAAAMWQQVTDELGAETRDSLWSHFDAVPTAEEVDDPTALIARLRGDEQQVTDDYDAALASLISDPDSFGEAPAGGVIRSDRAPKGDPSDPRGDGADFDEPTVDPSNDVDASSDSDSDSDEGSAPSV